MKYIIEPDYDCVSPRENMNLGTIVYGSNRYLLGDKKVTWEEMNQIIKNKNNVMLPVYAYIHGEITINTTGFSCSWDSGLVGYIYVSKDKIRNEFRVKAVSGKLKEKVLDILRAEIKEFDYYLTGQVYGYNIIDDDKVIDSCWGFYGEESAIMAAEESLNYWRKAA